MATFNQEGQKVKNQVNDVEALKAKLKEEKLQHGFTQISLDHKATHLNSCESALSDRDTRIERLETQLNGREWITWQSAEATYHFPCAFLATDGVNVEKIYWDKPPLPSWTTHCMPLPSPPKEQSHE